MTRLNSFQVILRVSDLTFMKWPSSTVSLQTQSYGAWGSHLSAYASSSEVILKIPAFQMFHESTLWVCFVGTAFSRRGIVFKWGGDLPAPPVSTNCRLNWYWDIVKNTSIITETCYSSPTDEYIYDMAYIWTAAAISVWIQLNCNDGAPLNEANPWVQLAPSCLSLNGE